MKKLVAAVLTGVLVAGTLSTGVYAKDDDKTITVAASATLRPGNNRNQL